MTERDNEQLREFQDSGDLDALLSFVKSCGLDETKYRDALQAMALVFEPLSFGLQPAYGELNVRDLREHLPEVRQIVGWMEGSEKADMKAAAHEVKRILDKE